MGREWLLGNQGTRMSWLQHNQSESGKLPRIRVGGIIIYLASNILSWLPCIPDMHTKISNIIFNFTSSKT